MKCIEEVAESIAIDFCKEEWLTERSYYSLIASLIKTFFDFSKESNLATNSPEFAIQYSRRAILEWEESKFLPEDKLSFLEGIIINQFSLNEEESNG